MAIEHLAAFRAAGLSSQQTGQQKTLRALDWIYAWGWSSSGVVDLVVSSGTKQRGTAAKLVKRGIVGLASVTVCGWHQRRSRCRVDFDG